MHSTCLSGLKNDGFWWEAVSVNLTLFVYGKTPQGTFKFDFLLPNVPDQNLKTGQHVEDKPRGCMRSNCSPSTYWLGRVWPRGHAISVSVEPHGQISALHGAGCARYVFKAMSTINLIALPIHPPDWRCKHTTMCLPLCTARCSILRSNSVAQCPCFSPPRFRLIISYMSCLYKSTVTDLPLNPSANLLSLSPSFCLQMQTLSRHLRWRWINTFSFHANAH